MVRGIYPTYAEALETLNADYEVTSVAFTKDFAVSRDTLGFFKIAFQGEEIAYGEAFSIKVPFEYKYMEKRLKEYGVNIHA